MFVLLLIFRPMRTADGLSLTMHAITRGPASCCSPRLQSDSTATLCRPRTCRIVSV